MTTFLQNLKTVLGHEAEIKTFFAKLSDQELIDKIMAGVRKEEIELKQHISLNTWMIDIHSI